ncbi:hypothetical protein D3C86_2070030 [compost metagenome]
MVHQQSITAACRSFAAAFQRHGREGRQIQAKLHRPLGKTGDKVEPDALQPGGTVTQLADPVGCLQFEKSVLVANFV